MGTSTKKDEEEKEEDPFITYQKNIQKNFECGMFNVIFHGIFIFYFFRYTFLNPDTGECWAIKDNQTPSDTSVEGHRNVSSNFFWWFLLGFVISFVMLIVGILQIVVFCKFRQNRDQRLY